MKCVPPSAVAGKARTTYTHRRGRWVAEPELGGPDSLSIALHPPAEAAVANDPDAVVAWVRSWHAYSGPGTVEWELRRWRSFGRQEVPVRLVLRGASEIAEAAGRTPEWRTVTARRQHLTDVLAPGTSLLAAAIASTHSKWLEMDEETSHGSLRSYGGSQTTRGQACSFVSCRFPESTRNGCRAIAARSRRCSRVCAAIATSG